MATLKELEARLRTVEAELARLRELASGSAPVKILADNGVPSARDPERARAELDAALDRLFEERGIKGKLKGLAQLRAMQAEQERLWAERRRERKSSRKTKPSKNE